MLARIWRGRVPAEKTEAYLQYLQATGLREYRETEGNREVWVFCHTEAGETEFLIITMWDSMEAIRRFAGLSLRNRCIIRKIKNFCSSLSPKCFTTKSKPTCRQNNCVSQGII